MDEKLPHGRRLPFVALGRQFPLDDLEDLGVVDNPGFRHVGLVAEDPLVLAEIAITRHFSD